MEYVIIVIVISVAVDIGVMIFLKSKENTSAIVPELFEQDE